ncbi:MAG: 1,4-dihydroxy-2-naphthoate octaprenyltransferase [Bacteroidales bacterium]|nr:1,4-dihydroxy-2-naphthoate octaprenyltransferase [Bacteroidales bacterium]
MKSIKLYIQTFRPRTLPLSVSGIILGSLLAASEGHFNVWTFILAILTTLCLQILSNISNELGDAQKGTDTADRKGPAYVLLSGALTQKDFKHLILLFSLLSVVFGSLLLYLSLDFFFSNEGLIMLAFGGLAIIASITYTLGRNPYGYKGWGDLFVFVFFGLLSTLGVYFLQSGQVPLLLLLPASACGFLITGVLNLNNIRDMETDKINRITLPLLLGSRKAKIYHNLLVYGAFVLTLIYNLLKGPAWPQYLFLLLLPLAVFHLHRVRTLNDKALDPQLPILVLLTILFSLVLGFTSFL